MTAIDRTAYPRPGVRLTREELGVRYDLTVAEIDFIRANARADTSRLLLAVLLKTRRDYVHLTYTIRTTDHNLGRAFDTIQKITAEIEEAAHQATDEVGARVAEIAARLSRWGSDSLDALVDRVSTSTSNDEKGRSLEELCSRLFEGVPGFVVTGRVRTETAEIDISIRNGSTAAPFSREEALILAECKNWSGKCGKDELVLFRQKVENRSQRCSLGFLISWNGFAGTVTKEMLRGSRERPLVVPVTGKEIGAAARNGDLPVCLRHAGTPPSIYEVVPIVYRNGIVSGTVPNRDEAIGRADSRLIYGANDSGLQIAAVSRSQ